MSTTTTNNDPSTGSTFQFEIGHICRLTTPINDIPRGALVRIVSQENQYDVYDEYIIKRVWGNHDQIRVSSDCLAEPFVEVVETTIGKKEIRQIVVDGDGNLITQKLPELEKKIPIISRTTVVVRPKAAAVVEQSQLVDNDSNTLSTTQPTLTVFDDSKFQTEDPELDWLVDNVRALIAEYYENGDDKTDECASYYVVKIDLGSKELNAWFVDETVKFASKHNLVAIGKGRRGPGVAKWISIAHTADAAHDRLDQYIGQENPI